MTDSSQQHLPPQDPETGVSRRDALRLTLGLAASLGGLSACAGTRNLVGRPIPDDPVIVPATIARSPAAAPAYRVRPLARSLWTPTQPKLWDTNPMGRITRITVHHDGMPFGMGDSQADAVDRLRRICKVHVEQHGWADIGYHYAIDPGGRIWDCRPDSLQGAHVKDNNEQNLGILVMGNFNNTTPTPAAKMALVSLITDKQRQHRVPMARVRTHQEINPTECPGRSLQAFMITARRAGGPIA
ncbi:MAG: peptidoglycan recognition family protein [Phycisphaerales bacterium JB040]